MVAQQRSFSFLRLIPILVLIIALGLFFYFDLYHYLSFSALAQHQAALSVWTQDNYVNAALVFMLVYTVAVAISVPGAAILTITGGFLFGPVFGSIFVVISATLGATIIFIAAKTAFANLLAQKAGRFVKQLEKGFQDNAFSYLLVLRLVPLFPFWLINIVPALLNIRLSIYVAATLIGIIPGSVVYVLVGNGLSALFASGQAPNFGIIFEPDILLPIIGLAVLALIPVLYKSIKKRKANKNEKHIINQ